jgi:hypothetical protein
MGSCTIPRGECGSEMMRIVVVHPTTTIRTKTSKGQYMENQDRNKMSLRINNHVMYNHCTDITYMRALREIAQVLSLRALCMRVVSRSIRADQYKILIPRADQGMSRLNGG